MIHSIITRLYVCDHRKCVLYEISYLLNLFNQLVGFISVQKRYEICYFMITNLKASMTVR